MENKKITIILSGGMDSITLLYFIMSKTDKSNIKALSINYGQKHKKELIKAIELCDELNIDHKIVNISEVQNLLESSLTKNNQKIPEGYYAKETMKQTVVPNRNAIMLSIAYGYAISNGSDLLLFGAHAGDHFIYPDCRPLFSEALDVALQIGNEGFGNVRILAPFIYKTKTEICKIGLELNVPYEKTWSCYAGEERPCLLCGTCTERYESFNDNGIKDPLLTGEEWKKAGENYKKAKADYENK